MSRGSVAGSHNEEWRREFFTRVGVTPVSRAKRLGLLSRTVYTEKSAMSPRQNVEPYRRVCGVLKNQT